MKTLYFNYGEFERTIKRDLNYNWFSSYREDSSNLRNIFDIKKHIAIVSDFCSRTNLNNNYFDRYFLDNQLMPDYDSDFNKKISIICDERAFEIQDKLLLSDKKLHVMWSGGIDSTAVLVSILKNFKSEALERVVVCLNYFSIVENPMFYLKYIKDKIKVDSVSKKYNLDSDYIFVDGEPGDFLFGSEFCLNKFMPKYGDYVYKDWKNNLDKIKDVLDNDWLINNQIENFTNKNVPVSTVMDFFWWINFDNRWSVKCFNKIISHLSYNNINNDTIKSVMENGINFFNTIDFQKWAMCKDAIEPNYIRSLTDYKMPLKNYIFDFDNNEYYKDYYIKLNSNSNFPKYSLDKPLIIYIDHNNNYNIINANNISSSKLVFQQATL